MLRLPDTRSIRGIVLLGLSATLAAGCGVLQRTPKDDLADRLPSAVDRSIAQPASILHLEALQRLLQADTQTQANLLDTARIESEASRLAPARLRYALLLGTPGHAGYDPSAALTILTDVLAVPTTLPPAERALALFTTQNITGNADLKNEVKKLRGDLERMERDQLGTLSRRLQAESEENAKLRKALDEAKAKLDAISKIETAGRKP
jgi:hypothetical protein